MTTQTRVRSNGDDTWEQLMAEQAEGVLPRSFLHEGEIINAPSDENPLPMRVTDLNFRGYRKVWDTKTGDMSLQPYWLLWQAARKHHPDGTQMFTTADPHIPQDHGEDLFCPLNPNAPEEERFTGMGFKPCRKQHIPHMAAQQSHLEHSHKRAFIAIQQKFERIQREEDRELQLRAITAQERVAEAMLSQVGGGAPTRRTSISGTDTAVAGECDTCHEQITAKNKLGLNSKMRAHMRNAHN